MTARALGLALLGLLAACAVGDGEYLVTLAPDTMTARLAVDPGRFTPDGWLRTDRGFAVRLDRLELDVGQLLLTGTQTPTGAPTPPGATPQPLLRLPAPGAVPVTVRAAAPVGGVALGRCQPGCGLSSGRISEGQISLLGLIAEGLVRDDNGRRFPGAVPLRLLVRREDAGLTEQGDAGQLAHTLDLPLSPDTPERLVLAAAIAVPPSLLDGLALDALGRDAGVVCLGGPAPCADPSAAWHILLTLARGALDVQLSDAAERP